MINICRLILLFLLSLITIACNDGSSSKIEETTVSIFEETFDQQGMWQLSADIITWPGSDDWAFAEIQNGLLTLVASQDVGCVHATASLTDDLTVSSDTIEIEMDFTCVRYNAMGDLSLELTINNIKIVFDLISINLATNDCFLSTLTIEHINGNTRVFLDGVEVPERVYTVENVEWDGLKIVFKADACGADWWASAFLEVDYIGIFEIQQI